MTLPGTDPPHSQIQTPTQYFTHACARPHTHWISVIGLGHSICPATGTELPSPPVTSDTHRHTALRERSWMFEVTKMLPTAEPFNSLYNRIKDWILTNIDEGERERNWPTD